MSEITRAVIQAPITDVMSSAISRLQFYNIAQGLLRDLDRVAAERDALQLLLNERDEQVHSLEQRRHAELQACQAAERRVEELEALVRDALDAFKYDRRGGCTSPPFRFVKPWAERAISALNPTAEAVSHDSP